MLRNNSRGGVEETEAKDKKQTEAKAKDPPSRGQGQECSRPRTNDITHKCFQKKVFNKFTARWRVLQDEEKKCHDLGRFFTKQKSAVLGRQTGHF